MKSKGGAPVEGVSVAMSLVDMLPVILFCAGGIVIFLRLGSFILLAGVIVCTAAGLCKAVWKLILALKKRDAAVLVKFFRVLMPCGFALIALSIPFAHAAWKALLISLFTLPALIFTIAGCAGMALMTVFAFALDGSKASSNWTEQLTNTVSQALFLTALLLTR